MEPLSPQLERLLADNVAAAKAGTTKVVHLHPGALTALPGYFAATFPGKDAVVVSDDHTFHAAGLAVETALAKAGINARRIILEPRAGDDHLVAEDGIDNQRLFAHHLKGTGALVTIVDNGQAAIDAALKSGTKFDLILMDMQMPVLDGYSAVTQLRVSGMTVPILAVTAHAMSGDGERCIAAGCSGFLSKPFTRSELLDACHCALQQSLASAGA